MTHSGCILTGKFTAIVIAIILGLTTGCQQESNSTAKAKKARPEHLVVTLDAISLPVATEHVRTGTIKVRHLARIYSQEEGKIASLPWFEGDYVSFGKQLLELDSKLLQAELKKAQADARQAKLDLKRIRNLQKKKAASDDELSRSRTAVSITQAELEILKTRLTYTDIRAPFNGIISERLVEPEDFVSKQTHLLTLINPSSLYIKSKISELLLSQLARHLPVFIHVDALGDKTFQGKIERIHPVIDPQTRQAVIEVSFDQLPDSIRSGQFARVTFKTRETSRILLPFNAVQHDRDGEYLYLLLQDKAVKTRIRSGIKIDDQIEILEGIDSGQQVIIQGFLGLADGKKVKVKTLTL